jgi:hypothetical protein
VQGNVLGYVNGVGDAAGNSDHVGRMNTASKLGPHIQTDRGTCPGVGL